MIVSLMMHQVLTQRLEWESTARALNLSDSDATAAVLTAANPEKDPYSSFSARRRVAKAADLPRFAYALLLQRWGVPAIAERLLHDLYCNAAVLAMAGAAHGSAAVVACVYRCRAFAALSGAVFGETSRDAELLLQGSRSSTAGSVSSAASAEPLAFYLRAIQEVGT